MIKSDMPTLRLPQGAIIMLDQSDVPAGFTRYTAQDGYFIRADSAPGKGGQDTHFHIVDIEVGPATPVDYACEHSCSCYTAERNHDHTGYSTHESTPASNIPPYVQVVLAQVDDPEGVEVPEGAILMSDERPGPGWEILSAEPGQPFYKRFLKADSTPDMSRDLGTRSHTHDQTTSEISAPIQGEPRGITTGGSGSLAAQDHTHPVIITFDNEPVPHIPPFHTVIIAKKVSDN